MTTRGKGKRRSGGRKSRGPQPRRTGEWDVGLAALAEAVTVVKERLDGRQPGVALVLGSGLGGVARNVADPVVISYADVPGFPATNVSGHSGQLIAGKLEGKPVLIQAGRFHLYEGHVAATAALPVRVFAELGIGTLIVTNAAGGIRLTLQPPVIMLISDHMNLMWRNPIQGPVMPPEERFPDMSTPYDKALRVLARSVALQAGIRVEEGVYAAVLGPSYETPAEIRMLHRIGADAVGMSTVPEVIVARARGMRVLGLSMITNPASGLAPMALAHDDVLKAGETLAGDVETLLRGVLRGL